MVLSKDPMPVSTSCTLSICLSITQRICASTPTQKASQRDISPNQAVHNAAAPRTVVSRCNLWIHVALSQCGHAAAAAPCRSIDIAIRLHIAWEVWRWVDTVVLHKRLLLYLCQVTKVDSIHGFVLPVCVCRTWQVSDTCPPLPNPYVQMVLRGITLVTIRSTVVLATASRPTLETSCTSSV